jgi:hypothetical protein
MFFPQIFEEVVLISAAIKLKLLKPVRAES